MLSRRRQIAALVVAAALSACGGSGDEPGRQDDFVPARDLSLAELAAPPEVELRPVEVSSRGGAGLQAVEERVRSGELDRVEADLMLLAALGGDEAAGRAALGESAVGLGLPDALPGVIAQRFESADESDRQRYQALVDRIATGAPIASWVDLLSPTPAHASTTGFPTVLADPAQRIIVLVHDGVSDTAAQSVLAAASSHWPSIRAFHGVGVGDTATATGGVRFYDWVFVDQDVAGAPAGSIGHVVFHSAGTPEISLEIVQPGGPPVEVEGVPLTSVTKADLVLEAKPSLSTGAGIFTRCSARGSWAAMNNRPAIEIDAAVAACAIPGAVAHELFHCAHATAIGAEDKFAFAEVPMWVIEGAATWSEDTFLPADNTEWPVHECYANPGDDPEACGGPVGPGVPLSERHHTAAMFLEFVEQRAGGDGAVRTILSTFRGGNTALESLPDAARGRQWLDFVDSSTGYRGLFDAGTRELVDLPSFPYESSTGCEIPSAAGQESYAARASLDEHFGAEVAVEVGPMAAQHVILELLPGASPDWVDVALDSELDASLNALDGEPTEVARIRALVRSNWGERSEDWVERWVDRADESPEVFHAGGPSDGSFRICLADVGPCEGVEPIQEGLYEIRLAIANAATATGSRLSGTLLIVPGKMPGWEAERYRRGTPEEQP